MKTLTKKKTTEAPEVAAAPNTTQSRHFKRNENGISGTPAVNFVRAIARNAIEGVVAMTEREVETVECSIYRWRNGKLVPVRTVTRPRTLVSNYRGRIALPKSREGDYTLLDELFDYDVESDGYQAPESVLRGLLEAWVAQHGQQLNGNDKLYLARAFSKVMAGRAGADIATIAGVA
jgi:hypothetical protein